MKAKLIKQELGYILFDEKGIPIGHTPNVLNNNTFSKLSLKNCQAIERGYDLEELANKEYLDGYDTTNLCRLAFKDGFQKALEILGDKKYSEEDMIRVFDLGFNTGVGWENGEDKINLKEHIQSLQTEWDVEVEMEQVYDGLDEMAQPQYSKQRKLDADDCLILKSV